MHLEYKSIGYYKKTLESDFKQYRILIASMLNRISEKNKEVNGFISVDPNYVDRQIEQLSHRLDKKQVLPLAGIPIAVKDNICTNGLPTTCASNFLRDYTPPFNATAVERLVEAGAVIVGKTNCDEFAMGSTTEHSAFGITRNPKNKDYVPGGSSGGSAAVVADGLVPIALGSDTGGSIRQPASFCGIVGFKPSYGGISRYGLVAYASSFDQIGPMAHSVEDCYSLCKVMYGKDEKDSTSEEILLSSNHLLDKEYFKGKKVGVISYFVNAADHSVKQRFNESLGVIKSLDCAAVDEVEIPLLKYSVPAYYVIATTEAASNLARFDGVRFGQRAEEHHSIDEMYRASREQGFGFEVKQRIMLGTFASSTGYYDAYYQKAMQVRQKLMLSIQKIFSEYDLLISPTCPTTAYKIGEKITNPVAMYAADVCNVLANLVGSPAISIPMGIGEESLPVGIQFMAAPKRDIDVFNSGYSFQQNWS